LISPETETSVLYCPFCSFEARHVYNRRTVHNLCLPKPLSGMPKRELRGEPKVIAEGGVAITKSASSPPSKVTVIGAGRLGLCWGLCVEKAGIAVKAVDIFPSYVEAINKKTLVSHEPSLMDMLQASTQLDATLSLAEGVAFSPYLFVFVQTPSSGTEQHYDHTHLNDVLSQINTLRVRDAHVVICCTVMPGYCDTIAPALLADCMNVTVSYSPEFIAQGAIIEGTLRPDVALIGEGSEAAGDMLEALTRAYVLNDDVTIHRISPGSAEIAKLALNGFVTLKIAFANFLGDLADAAEVRRRRYAPATARDDPRRRIDKLDVARAIGSDSRVGSKCLLPGYVDCGGVRLSARARGSDSRGGCSCAPSACRAIECTSSACRYGFGGPCFPAC